MQSSASLMQAQMTHAAPKDPCKSLRDVLYRTSRLRWDSQLQLGRMTPVILTHAYAHLPVQFVHAVHWR